MSSGTQRRGVARVRRSHEAMEGAGVRLKRVFGSEQMDPFLLLDDFSSDKASDYESGFPWHPHRGIETITYVLEGLVEHEDSLGNKGVIEDGDVQWMTAGSGIIHQEMPKPKKDSEVLRGFQLWANLPAASKMIDPHYQDIKSGQVPVVSDDDVTVRVIAGEVNGVRGPVEGVSIRPQYLDVSIQKEGGVFDHPIPMGHTAFAYTIEGSAVFGTTEDQKIGPGHLVVLRDGDYVRITATSPLRFLLISGKPIGEKVAWQGPIVMNTVEELRVAFREVQEGTFCKVSAKNFAR